MCSSGLVSYFLLYYSLTYDIYPDIWKTAIICPFPKVKYPSEQTVLIRVFDDVRQAADKQFLEELPRIIINYSAVALTVRCNI